MLWDISKKIHFYRRGVIHQKYNLTTLLNYLISVQFCISTVSFTPKRSETKIWRNENISYKTGNQPQNILTTFFQSWKHIHIVCDIIIYLINDVFVKNPDWRNLVQNVLKINSTPHTPNFYTEEKRPVQMVPVQMDLYPLTI